jgi:D-alanyl-lipoteichoic acid acyltransferase DltB (MBOAT superfamily)
MTLATASLQFLAYALAIIIVFNFRPSVAWRQFVLLAASIGFLTFFSHRPAAFFPLTAFLLFGFLGLRLMQAGATRLFFPLLIVAVVSFIWLKKYTFIPSSLFLHGTYVTLGLSYICFRVLHLIIDARPPHSPLSRKISFVSYLNYILNFTTLVSGPIQRYNQFSSMQLAPEPLRLDIFIAAAALERIVVGFFKVNVLSRFMLMIQTSYLNSLATAHSATGRVFTAVVIVAIYPLYIYCNFSGYIDIVIGIARFLRIELPENFNRPFSSQNYLIFWSRWHITLSSWLQTYVFLPLMLKSIRRWPSPAIEPFLNVSTLFVTFLLVGVWHGQTSAFVFFGVLLGLGVSLTKLYQVLMAKCIGTERYAAMNQYWLYNTAARGLTYTWCALTMLWFWSNWAQLASLARFLGLRQISLVSIVIFLGSAVALALWEAGREWLLSFQFENQPALSSRYVRTVWATVLLVISIATMTLLNAPPPDIVYKTF